VIAVDIPSGLDADTGRPRGAAVRAHLTVTMGFPKIGFPHAAEFTGDVVVADIGYPPELSA
jgi:NAD(P)H-hydrate epimerase